MKLINLIYRQNSQKLTLFQRSKSYWIDLIRRTIEENEEEEEIEQDEILIQSEALAKKWFKKCSKARMGIAE